jgi:stage V sporulation protein D (sporulation-specific penicillin-binding protein)
MTRRRYLRRVLLVLTGMAAWTLWLVWRVVDVQVVQASRLDRVASSLHEHTFVVPAPRGAILDRHGHVLALDVPAYEVVAAPTAIGQAAATVPHLRTREADLLARYLPYPAGRIRQALSGQGWYRVLDADLPAPAGAALARQAGNLPGISVVPVSRRSYPDGSLAAQVLGFVGADGKGLGGIEYAENAVLAGRPGRWTVATDAQGTPLPAWQVSRIAPVPGDDVELTLDGQVQLVVERALAAAMKTTHAVSGTVIVMDPATGAVLALANAPGFNPADVAHVSPTALTDWAVEDPVPPGSIFKPVTAAAALTEGIVTPGTMFDTRGYKIVNGVRINDWNLTGWGWISFAQAFALSSDQVFMDLGLKLGVATLYRYIRAFGLMQPSGVGLPGDSNSIFLPASQVNAVDLATIAFGQGFAVTPMQMLKAVAAIANDGTMMEPRIVRAVLAPDGRVLHRYGPVVAGHPISPAIAAQVQQLMEQEVASGTGIKAAVPGYVLAGKTGTAQKVVGGRTSSTRFISSFIGYGPMPHPRFAMLVMINQPVGQYYGGDVAAPVFGAIARQLLAYWHIPPAAAPPPS